MALPTTRFLLVVVALIFLGAATVAQELFVNFTIDGASPLLSADKYWETNNKTLYRTSIYWRHSPTDLVINFVGNGFKLFGRLQGSTGFQVTPDGNSAHCTINGGPPKLIFPNEEGGGELASDSKDVTTLYNLSINHDILTTLTFHNLTFEVRIVTEAPSFEALSSVALEVPVVHDGAQNQLLNITQFTSGDVIKDSESTANPRYIFKDEETLELRNLTELHYTPPDNTSLVQVLGLTVEEGYLRTMSGRTSHRCAAILDPRPLWWNETAGPPLAWQDGPLNISHKDLFILPLDPAVRYTLKVLPRYNSSYCRINAIKAYSYFYDGSDSNKTSTNPSGPPNGGTDEKAGSGRAAAIAGGVVGGVIGAIIVIALIVWLSRRHLLRQQQKERTIPPEGFEVDATDGPDSILTPFVQQTSATDTAGSEEAGASKATGLGSSQADNRSITRPLSPLVLQEEDAEDVDGEERPVEVLPPRYRPAWGQRIVVTGGQGDSETPANRSEKQAPRAEEDEPVLRRP